MTEWSEQAQADYRKAQAAIAQAGSSSSLFFIDLPELRAFPAEIANSVKTSFLAVRKTRISDLSPLASLRNLSRLDLAETPVSDLSPLAGASRLETLSLSDTEVADLGPLAGMPMLRRLHLERSPVADLGPLGGLARLWLLELGGTQVEDLSPLRDLPNLEVLDLGGTRVADLSPLRDLRKLRVLKLDGTRVEDLSPLRDLPNLRNLGLRETPLAELEAFRPLEPFLRRTNGRSSSRLDLQGCRLAQENPEIARIVAQRQDVIRAELVDEILRGLAWAPPAPAEGDRPRAPLRLRLELSAEGRPRLAGSPAEPRTSAPPPRRRARLRREAREAVWGVLDLGPAPSSRDKDQARKEKLDVGMRAALSVYLDEISRPRPELIPHVLADQMDLARLALARSEGSFALSLEIRLNGFRGRAHRELTTLYFPILVEEEQACARFVLSSETAPVQPARDWTAAMREGAQAGILDPAAIRYAEGARAILEADPAPRLAGLQRRKRAVRGLAGLAGGEGGLLEALAAPEAAEILAAASSQERAALERLESAARAFQAAAEALLLPAPQGDEA